MKYIFSILFVSLFLFQSCKEEKDDTDRVYDYEYKSSSIEGVWHLYRYYKGVSLSDFSDEGGRDQRLVQLNKDGSGHVFCVKYPGLDDEGADGCVISYDVDYTFDRNSISLYNKDSGETQTWLFGDYGKTKRLNSVYREYSGKKYNYEIYSLDEIRTDSALYSYCCDARGVVHVPESRVWKDKTIVGYYACDEGYLHFKENGEVSRWFRNEIVTGSYEAYEKSGVDYLRMDLDGDHNDAVAVYDSTRIFVYAPAFSGIIYSGYDPDPVSMLGKIKKSQLPNNIDF